MKPLKNRKTNLISKRKLTVAINLFEKYVDEPIVSINLYNYTDTIYEFVSVRDKYHIDIAKNSVEKVYGEEWDE